MLKHTHAPFPQEPRAQLVGARDAVFKSWMNPRAITYRNAPEAIRTLAGIGEVEALLSGAGAG